MRLIGQEQINTATGRLKAVWNENGLIIFPVSLQHHQAGTDGIRYAESGGNALAVLFDRESFEVRGHPDFSDERVRNLWRALQGQPGLERISSCRLIYQGREL